MGGEIGKKRPRRMSKNKEKRMLGASHGVRVKYIEVRKGKKLARQWWYKLLNSEADISL